MILFFSLGFTLYSFCVGVYVMSVPGYNVDSWYSFGPIITLYDQITARECKDRLGNQVHL
jgi:hypothetical protein